MKKIFLFFSSVFMGGIAIGGPFLPYVPSTNTYHPEEVVNIGSATITVFQAASINSTGPVTGSSFTGTTVTGSTGTFSSMNNSQIGGRRNLVINGDFAFDQTLEGGTTAQITNTNTYPADMFFTYDRGFSGKWTMQRLSSGCPTGFPNCVQLVVSSATSMTSSSEAANAEYVASMRIPAPDIGALKEGTSAAQPLSLQFWFQSSIAGPYGFNLESSTGADSYPMHFSYPTPSVWVLVSTTIPANTTGTWVTSQGSIGVKLIWDLGSGTGFQTSATGWQTTGELNHFSGDTQWIKTLAAKMWFAGVQLEPGSTPSNFEWEPHDLERQRCRAYYRKSYQDGTRAGTSGTTGRISLSMVQVNTTTMKSQVYQFIPTMNSDPSCTLWDTSGTQGNWFFTSTSAGATSRAATTTDTQRDGFQVQQTSAVEYLGQGHFECIARLGGN